MPLLILNEDELRQTITISEAIDVVEAAFAALAEGRMNVPGSFSLQLPEVNGNVDVRGAYLQETPYYVIKAGSNFRDNPSINLPAKSGLITVFDAATGFPAAIMVDNGYLTHIRAGAAGAIAAEYLAARQTDHITVIGAGSRAFMQLKSLMSVRNFVSASVWASSPLDADNYARRMVEDHDINIQIAPSVKEAVQNANLIIADVNAGHIPLEADWLKAGVHITVLGSNIPSKPVLTANALQQVDVIIVDNYDQCATSGEIHHGLSQNIISQQTIQGDLGNLVSGKLPGRTHSEQITLADLTGLDTQDAVVATLAMEKALFLGLGQRVEVGIAQQSADSRIENML